MILYCASLNILVVIDISYIHYDYESKKMTIDTNITSELLKIGEGVLQVYAWEFVGFL